MQELKDIFGFEKNEILITSSKTGLGIVNLLNTIVDTIPPPTTDCHLNLPPKLLFYDSFWDNHKGVIGLVYVKGNLTYLFLNSLHFFVFFLFCLHLCCCVSSDCWFLVAKKSKMLCMLSPCSKWMQSEMWASKNTQRQQYVPHTHTHTMIKRWHFTKR